MKAFITVMVAIAVSVFPFRFVYGQSQEKPDVLRVRTNEVRLDVVVKDKKGHAVKDLTPADFEVLEDGVSQKIQSFRFVNREPSADSSPNRSADQADRKQSEPETSKPLTPPR